MLRSRVRAVIANEETSAGKAFAWSIRGLIVLSVVSFSIETLPDLNSGLRAFLQGLEIGIVAIFTLEYLLRIAVSEKISSYALSAWGLVDLAAILPFYLAVGVDLRSLRALRLLRMLKVFRYSRSVDRFATALKEIRDDLIVFGFTAILMLYLSSVGIYIFESQAQPDKFGSVFDCLWWAVCTLTTVGYGDIYPVTVGGRLFTFVVLVIGLGTVAIPSGLLASALTRKPNE